jgi:TrmH family RNA methyltransferase
LLKASARARANACLVDSPHAIAAALDAGAHVRELFVSAEDRWHDLVARATSAGVPVTTVPERLIGALSDTSTPQGLVAVIDLETADVSVLARVSLGVVLADVRDPGNAGTVLRCAAAAGADAVIFTTGAVDPLHPKTVRASAGASWRVPILHGLSLEAIVEIARAAGIGIVGADARADTPVDRADLTRRTLVVLGNEAWGIAAEARGLLDASFSIPMPGLVESLNVGAAGAIFLYEAVRQRRVEGASD